MNNRNNSGCGSGGNCSQNQNCSSNSNRVCGASIDLGGAELSNARPNLVYLDKVFSFNHAESCPIFLNDLKASTLTGFQVFCETEDRRCDCQCATCVIDEQAEFIIERATATLDFIGTRPSGNISPCQVTICGENPDSITFANHRYTVNAADAAEAVQKERCLDLGEPTRCMFLIRNVGPWEFRATFVLTGLMNSHGRTCRFRAVFTNTDGPMTTLPGNCANFVIPDLAVPCAINGVAPDITFQFSGDVNLVNPRLKVKCRNTGGCRGNDAELACIPCVPCCPDNQNQTCLLTLCTNLIVIPKVQVEVVRRTLFSVNGREVLVPCDQAGGTVMGSVDQVCGGGGNCCGQLEDICGDLEDICGEQEDVCGEQAGSCIGSNQSCRGRDRNNDLCSRGQSVFYDVFGSSRQLCGTSNSNSVNNCRSPRTAFQFMGYNGCSW